MNRVVLMGRLIRGPEVGYSQGGRSIAIARYTLAMDRRGRRDRDNSAGQQTADFINRVAFGCIVEFVEKYFCQGVRVFVSGRIQTGSYVNREGQEVYTIKVISDDRESVDSRGVVPEMGGYIQAVPSQKPAPTNAIGDGFMNTLDGMEGEGFLFNQDVPWLVVKEDNISGT